ncbi:S8 family peptidase [Aquimarina addita]|uniref:S8 family peptidase n=1 Tax=Aquimarina addita TaxID=870485 RepID=A0ABP6UVJ6_9FLAO
MKKIYLILFFASISNYSKKSLSFNITSEIMILGYQEKTLSNTIMNKWQHKDVIADTIPGVSSEKAYEHLLSKKGKTVIVAIIDSGVDINHEDLKNQIWVNYDEIPNNDKDDDDNGYIDDIYGWNFLGNSKDNNIYYARNEYVRILNNKGFFDKNGELTIPKEEKDSVILEAAKFYKTEKALLEENKTYIIEQKKEYETINNQLKEYFPLQKYTFEKLKTIDTLANAHLKAPVKKLHEFLEYELTQDWLKEFEEYNDIIENYKLNPNYNDRQISSDNKNKIVDKNYGNDNIVGDIHIENHGTIVAGLIGASRDNGKGINGIADNVKLMILRAVPHGDEYDKDIALAIRYAVDNGAEIINMSFGKFFSPQQGLVSDAIAYAAKKDVLIVHAAGNDSQDTDKNKFYPIDYSESIEFTENFINVGAINYKLNRKLPAYFSNYGKINVDVFAPGYNLYTTSPDNKYINESGTSLAAPVVSGIAALIRSQYPKLKASEVKKILMDSGNSYSLEVTIPGKRDSPKVPFSELSKSGKVVNAYNALLMAEQVSKKN